MTNPTSTEGMTNPTITEAAEKLRKSMGTWDCPPVLRHRIEALLTALDSANSEIPNNPALASKQPTDTGRYREALDSIIQYGSDTLSGQFVEREDRAKWYRDGVKEIVRRARAAMKATGEG